MKNTRLYEIEAEFVYPGQPARWTPAHGKFTFDGDALAAGKAFTEFYIAEHNSKFEHITSFRVNSIKLLDSYLYNISEREELIKTLKG